MVFRGVKTCFLGCFFVSGGARRVLRELFGGARRVPKIYLGSVLSMVFNLLFCILEDDFQAILLSFDDSQETVYILSDYRMN